jgi:hypothetical protein
MNIRILKEEALVKLKSNIDNNLGFYESGDLDSLVDDDSFVEVPIDIGDLDLTVPGDKRASSDPANMRLIHKNMRDITESQAGDERLWAGLAHSLLWDYMQKRWPIKRDDTKENKIKYIATNYFFNHGKQRSLLTNGISRLWWFSRLLYDGENKENPYALLEYIEQDINARGFLLFGSNFANNPVIRKRFIYGLIEFEEENDMRFTRDQFKNAVKLVNMWGGSSIIDHIDRDYFTNRLSGYLSLVSKS